MLNKKVLLHESKGHAARRVASARFADGGWGGTPSTLGWGGTSSSLGPGGCPRVPPPDLGLGTHPSAEWSIPLSIPGMGYPPIWTWAGVTPPIWTWDGVPPCLDLRWGTSQTWDRVHPHPPRPGMGYPPTQT